MNDRKYKVRLTTSKRKPFWISSNDYSKAVSECIDFYNRFISYSRRFNIKRKGQLQLDQKYYNFLEGATTIYYKRYSKSIDPKHLKLCKRYGIGKRRYSVLVNKLEAFWRDKSIFPVPVPKIILSSNDIPDPSGINTITKEECVDIILRECYGTFFQNSVNFYKYSTGCKISLNYYKNDLLYSDVDAGDFLVYYYNNMRNVISTADISRNVVKNTIHSIYGLTQLYTYKDFVNEIIVGEIDISIIYHKTTLFNKIDSNPYNVNTQMVSRTITLNWPNYYRETINRCIEDMLVNNAILSDSDTLIEITYRPKK